MRCLKLQCSVRWLVGAGEGHINIGNLGLYPSVAGKVKSRDESAQTKGSQTEDLRVGKLRGVTGVRISLVSRNERRDEGCECYRPLFFEFCCKRSKI